MKELVERMKTRRDQLGGLLSDYKEANSANVRVRISNEDVEILQDVYGLLSILTAEAELAYSKAGVDGEGI
jgi:hypothetical protein